MRSAKHFECRVRKHHIKRTDSGSFGVRLLYKYLMPRGRTERDEMAEKKNILTSSGAQKLEDELRNLKVVRRAEIAQKIKEARAQGDLTENAEYDAAKDEQAEIESRIDEIERILKNSEIVDAEGDLSSVFIGAKVRVLDMEFDEEEEIQIVGSNEANSMENKVSNESPLGMALLGAGIGDVVTVNAPGGDFQYKVLAIARQ